MNISIVIPAYNEEAYLEDTLNSIEVAAARILLASSDTVEVIVVDNDSEDATAGIALSRGANVIHEPVRGISRARNSGTQLAGGEVLVFVDADVIVPPEILQKIQYAMSDPSCVGGGVVVEFRPHRFSMTLYLTAWRLLGRLLGMVQGATQFCRRSTFEEIGGYDETAWIGEDVDFYWAMKRFARRTGRSVKLITSPRVLASSRRFDGWPVWKALLWTNPLFIALLRKRESFGAAGTQGRFGRKQRR